MKQIKLTEEHYATVDDADYELVSKYKWRVLKNKHTNYASTTIEIDGKRKRLSMHRLILNAPKGLEVDHKDFNGLNNTRENIRLCTRSENQKNKKGYGTSIYLGVCLHRTRNTYTKKNGFVVNKMSSPRYKAAINVDGKQRHIGSFKNEEDAARAYNEAALKYHGEFARLNVIEEDNQ